MDKKKEFEKIMNEATKLALASSVDNVPNVRILNFVYSENENVLYFQSRKGDQKEKEFEKNENVAFTTIPDKGLSYVRTNHSTIKKSEKTIFEVQDMFIEKMSYYKQLIEKEGNTMDLYEVRFLTAMVFPDPDKFEQIELSQR